MPRSLTKHFKPLFMIAACIILHTLSIQTAIAAVTMPITITKQAETINFPKSIDFQVQIKDSASRINNVVIYLSYNNDGYAEEHSLKLPAKNIIEGTWHEDTNNNYSAVGTSITYYWHITDTLGAAYNTPPKSFTITDTRFNWQHLSQGKLQINWYDRPQTFGMAVLAQAEKALVHIQANLGGGLTRPIMIWIYAKDIDFHNALPPDVHEWVGGIAFPNLNQASIVAYTSNDDTLIRDMPHEITHLVFHQISNDNHSTPLWFDEGQAVYNQFYHEPEMSRRFKQALTLHTLLHFNDLSSNFPADSDKAYLSYAQSWKLVDYMYTTFGVTKMSRFIHDLGQKESDWDHQMTKDLGLDQDHLENQWLVSLHQPSIPLSGQESITAHNQKAHPLPPPALSDPLAPLLLTIGLLMVLTPMCGLGGLFLFWQKKHPQEADNVNQRRPRLQNEPSKTEPRGTYTDPRSYQDGGSPDPQHLPHTPQVLQRGDYAPIPARFIQDYYTEQGQNNPASFPHGRAPQE